MIKVRRTMASDGFIFVVNDSRGFNQTLKPQMPSGYIATKNYKLKHFLTCEKTRTSLWTKEHWSIALVYKGQVLSDVIVSYQQISV